jgi:outer membrane protein
MNVRSSFIAWAVFCGNAGAQNPSAVYLADAQQIALRNHPRIASAALAAEAGGFATKQVRSAYYPTLSGNISGVGSEHNSTLSAGALTTSSIFSRAATGFSATQLVTDFGRTASLEQSAKLRNAAQNQNVTNIRAQVQIAVRPSY